jgi:hypothetical protein
MIEYESFYTCIVTAGSYSPLIDGGYIVFINFGRLKRFTPRMHTEKCSHTIVYQLTFATAEKTT